MNIGELNKRILIQQRCLDIDENGFEVEVWKDFKLVWAKIKNINGREYFQAQQANSKASKKVTIRYIKELDHDGASLEYRVVYKNTNYNILYPDNIKEENKFIEFLLETV